MTFTRRQSSIDEHGRYISLQCSIENKMWVLANSYIPPPFKTEILYKLMEFILDKPDIPVIVVGDFNTVMDRSMDRFSLGSSKGIVPGSQLSQFLGEAGLVDNWWNLKSRCPAIFLFLQNSLHAL